MGKIYSTSQFKEGIIVRTLSGSMVNFGNVLLVLCVCPCTFISGLQGNSSSVCHSSRLSVSFAVTKTDEYTLVWNIFWSVTELFGSSSFCIR